MSSNVQSALAQLQINDYISLVIVTAVIYDYCLTISKEVTYIWKRPWTRVSTLFLVVRYVGLISAFTISFSGTTFIPGPVKPALNTLHDIRRYIIYILSSWANMVFWIAADMVMILRVYAMYNRSKIILGVLLVMYITQVVIFVIGTIITNDTNHLTVSVAQLLDITVCNNMFNIETWSIVTATTQSTLGTVLCVMVTIKFMRDSFKMYRAMRTWQMNKYIRLLVRDGFFYFLTTLSNSMIVLLSSTQGSIFQGTAGILIPPLFYVLLITLTPRFVLNIRELYVLDTQGRRKSDVDTGFDLSSGAGRRAGGTTIIGTIVFAGQEGTTGGLEDGKETPIGENM